MVNSYIELKRRGVLMIIAALMLSIHHTRFLPVEA